MSTTQEKPMTLKSLSHKEDLLTGGHRMCSGCGAPTIVHQVLLAIAMTAGAISYQVANWVLP